MAVSKGVRELRAVVVVTEIGGVSCDACCQALSEFGKDAEVIVANAKGEVVLETTVSDLLPTSFDAEDLPGE